MSMKYKALADRLREELTRDGGRKGDKLPTELELSRRYQLSRQTVRHALRLLEEEGLIQRRQGSGSYATGKAPSAVPRQIALVTSYLDDYIFPAILHDAQAVFAQAGYGTLLYTTENQAGAEREILLKEPVCGLLAEGGQDRPADAQRGPVSTPDAGRHAPAVPQRGLWGAGGRALRGG